MRARRSSVSGCASGSASAAAWTSSSVSASKRLQSCFPIFFMISASLIGFGLAGGDDPNFLAVHRVADEQQAALHHANHAVAFLVLGPAPGPPIQSRTDRGIPRAPFRR